MKVMFTIDYFWPFTPGGSEWSVYYLSKDLKAKGVDNLVVTPNYGTKDEEEMDGVRISRFNSFTKLKSSRSVVSPIWQNNLFFFIWSGFKIAQIAKKEKVDLIHVQGKFLIPGSYIAGKLLNLPVIVTSRDKQFICSYGKCFFDGDRLNGCGWFEYLTKDFSWYMSNYVPNKSIGSYLYNLLAAIWTRISYWFITFFAKNADVTVAISKSHKKYLEANGFKNVKVIYNTMIFEKKPKLVKKRRGILFAGKLSLGKGFYELLEAVTIVSKRYSEKFIFAGTVEDPLRVKKFVEGEKIKKYVVLLGGVDHHKLQKLYRESKVVLMPSIYPESFGRVALEGLAAGTPVVVSDRGGMPEIIDNKRTGVVSKPNARDLAKSIELVLSKLDFFINNVKNSRNDLIERFETAPLKDHINLYRSLIK